MNSTLVFMAVVAVGIVVVAVMASQGSTHRALPASRHLALPASAGQPMYQNEETWEIEWKDDLPIRVVVHRDARRF